MEAPPDEWAVDRLKLLQIELQDLRQSTLTNRKRRIRSLQLELHPDKQPPERQKSASALFLLVQAEWEAALKEESGRPATGASGSVGRAGGEQTHHFREAWYFRM